MKKYLVHNNAIVRSLTDGQIHRIPAGETIRRHRVDPRECVITDFDRPETRQGYTREFLNGLKYLSPSGPS